VQEVELAEVFDHRLAHRALEGEVELLERLASRAALDGRLATSLAAQGLERGLVRRVGEGQLAGEGAAVRGDEPAAIQRHRRDLALADADLHPTPGEGGIERVVIRLPAQIGLLGHPGEEAAVGLGHPLGQGRIRSRSETRGLGWHRADAAVDDLT
jgi:hypothetical protein